MGQCINKEFIWGQCDKKGGAFLGDGVRWIWGRGRSLYLLQVSHLFLKKEKVGFTRDSYLGEGVPIQEDRLVDFRSITEEDLLLVEVELE